MLLEAEMTSNSPAEPQKRWGWVSTRPSEFLIVFRRGRVAERLCGQGGRFFKWPSDSYAVVPTTLKEVVFHASQITSDLVDVKVRGMVVFRIAEPKRIYSLINFTDRQAGEAKLAQMIADMCRSLGKWLIANLKLDECIRRRKEEIATALSHEVAKVASEKWGVEIVTLDIQDVFIQDAALFEALQVGYRAEKQREAELVRVDAQRAITGHQLDCERALEKERQELALEKAQRESAVEMVRLELVRRRDEEQSRSERLRAEQADALASEKLAREEERARIAAEGQLARARLAAEMRRIEATEATRALAERLAAESSAGPASLERLMLTEAVPHITKLVAASLANAKLHIYQGGDGRGMVPLVLGEVLDAVRGATTRQGAKG
jgi:regulator of protease activity HflC (stomatin/prohibitin superfamily)